MKELSLEECSNIVDRAIKRDKQISPTVAHMLESLEQPVHGTAVLSCIMCVLQDYNRDELMEIIAVNLFLKIHGSRQASTLLNQILKELGIIPPPDKSE
jgi:hypothetical protein